MKDDILQRIALSVKERLSQRKLRVDFPTLKKQFPHSRRPLDFKGALSRSTTNIIAELKPQSPSEGKLREEFPLLEIGAEYVKNGATALSVLTEEDHFGGHKRNLEMLRGKFPAVPLLMKDFIIDEYQIYEAALLGADAILLIVALLTEEELVRFSKIADSLKLSCLVEIHDEAELEIAMKHKFNLIGVNNRNLKTLKVSLETSRALAPLVDKEVTLICESGIKSAFEIKEMKALGFKGFLIGSTFIKSPSPGKKLAEFIERSK